MVPEEVDKHAVEVVVKIELDHVVVEVALTIDVARCILVFIVENAPVKLDPILNEIWLFPINREAKEHSLVVDKDVLNAFRLDKLVLVLLGLSGVISYQFLELVVVLRQPGRIPVIKQVSPVRNRMPINPILIHLAPLTRPIKDDSLTRRTVLLLPQPLNRNAYLLSVLLKEWTHEQHVVDCLVAGVVADVVLLPG